jgi:DNA-directed RNA polymerase beta subunit
MAQIVPLKKGEPAIVETGAEYIAAQITSSKFLLKAKDDGEVIDVQPDKYMTVKYKNGNIDNLNIRRRYSVTKRNSIITLNINTLKKGDKFKKDQLIAWNDHFDGKNNVLANGINCKLAVMNYLG